MNLISNPKVNMVFDNYPGKIKKQMLYLREMVIEVATNLDGLEDLEETLKWGEPSYLTKHGSTIRMDWKSKQPDQYCLYFKCTSKLVPTFKKLYKNKFKFENNRAIVFKIKDKIPEAALKQCITMALSYHKIKHLPLLGAL